MHLKTPRLFCRRAVCLLLLGTVAAMSGCGSFAAWLGHGVAGGERTYRVEARYRGLENRKVAVLVAADEYTLYQWPGAPLNVSRAVSRRIAGNVEGVTIVPPGDVIAFQRDNPYWNAAPYSDLIRRLGVDRLVIIDLIEYRTHEPGNTYVWQGVAAGDVGVVEAESGDPDNFAFSQVVRSQFPEDVAVGLVNSTDKEIEQGLLLNFSRDAAGLFYDHKVTK